MIIDATDLIVGRLASFVAKQSLLREQVEIINCEKAMITGSKENLLERYYRKYERGDPLHGPYYPKTSNNVMRRIIRGMLPYSKPRGREAFKRVKCYIGTPKELEGKKNISIKEFNIRKVQNLRYMKLGELCKFLGGR